MKLIWRRLWARKYAFWMATEFIQSFTNNPEFSRCPNKLFVPEGNLYAIYYSENEFARLAKRYSDFLLKQNLAGYAKWYEAIFQKGYDWAKRFSRINFRKTSNAQLAHQLLKMEKWFLDLSDWQFAVWPVAFGIVEEVEARVGKLPEGKKILEAISTPYRETKITKAKLDLLLLASRGKINDRSLASHARKYAWVPMYEFLDRPWRISHFRQQAKAIKSAHLDLAEYRAKRKAALLRYKKFIKSIHDKRFRKKVEIAHISAYLKEMRDDYRRPGYYVLAPFWKELARRIGVSFEDTNYLTTRELVDILLKKAKPDRRTITARKKKYALALKNGKLLIYSGQQANKISEKVKSKDLSSSLTGAVASPGQARGKVKIIYHQGEFKKFNKNDIIVTTMTHPEFLPIMKVAKAIVTDEGGITSHAAIVSRELGIPCIIGTKFATQVLKDGDLVEVDANKGIIRKL